MSQRVIQVSLEKVRKTWRRLRTHSQKYLEEIVKNYVALGEAVSEVIEQTGMSIRQIAELLAEPGLSKDTLAYSLKLSKLLRHHYNNNLSLLVDAIKNKLGPNAGWEQIIRNFLVERRRGSREPEPQATPAEPPTPPAPNFQNGAHEPPQPSRTESIAQPPTPRLLPLVKTQLQELRRELGRTLTRHRLPETLLEEVREILDRYTQEILAIIREEAR